MAYMAVAWWCHVCDKTLVLRNIGYKCLNQFRNDPHFPPVFCQLCSRGPVATQQRVVIRGGCPSRPGSAAYTLGPFIASESLLARLAYKSSSNFASGRVFVFSAAKASDTARAGVNYRNRKWEAKDFLLACYPFQISCITVCCTTVLCFVTQRASPQRGGKVI